MAIRLVKRNPLHWWQRLLLPFGAVLLAVLLSSLFILLAGANPANAWLLIVEGSMGSRFSFLETLVKMAPLTFCGLAVGVAFRAKFWNIGAEGQLYVGAFMAAWIGHGGQVSGSFSVPPAATVQVPCIVRGVVVLPVDGEPARYQVSLS